MENTLLQRLLSELSIRSFVVIRLNLNFQGRCHLKVPERRRAEVLNLISLINEQLWVGHFDLWNREHVVMFRHALVLAGGARASGRQCAALLESATEACDRFYQAFQFVVWAGKGAREAFEAAIFETEGEA